MIYLNNNTEVQEIFIPKQEITAPANPKPTYENGFEDGKKVGFNEGKEYQKDQLLNLYVTENGQYEREDGWGVVTVDVPTEEGGSCNLGEGSILLDTTMTGTYEMYASDDGYDGWSKFIVTLENSGAIKIHKASDLLVIFNNGGNIDYGTYYYVGGQITEIQEVSTQYGNATYTLDNGFEVYRGKWMDGVGFSSEDQIKVGAYIVVYGVIADYKGTLQFNAGSKVIAYQECEGSCNLEDKWVTPSMGDRDDNGLIVVNPSEGYDGMSRTVINPQTIYDEGVSAGKAEGGDLTLGTGDKLLTANDRGQRFEVLPSEFGYDAFDKFIVELENFGLGGDANIYDALSVNQLLMDGVITYDNKYIFKGEITEIQRIRPDYGDARYTLDGSLNVYNGQTMGYDIQVGDNVIVYGTLSEYNGTPQLSAGSEIKAWWREGGGGSCNLGILDMEATDPYYTQKYASDDGLDGYSEIIVRTENLINQEKENAINEFKNKMQEITITENGTYSIDDAELQDSIAFDGNSYFDTGIVPTENIKIEVCIKVTDGNDAGMGGIIIGGGIAPVDSQNYNGNENRGIAIGMGGGAIYGVWGATRSYNNPYEYEKTTTVVLQKTDDSWGWEGEKGSFGASTLYIGGYNKNGEEVEEKFTQSIVYIKIWTNKDDDSTMTLFRPKNMAQGGFGMVNSEGTEYNYVENLGSGTTTFVEEWVNIYPYGFKRVEVNVPSIDNYNYHILTAIGGVVDYGDVPFNVTTFRQKAYNITSFWSDKANAVIENGNLSPNVLVHSLIFGTGHIGAYSFQNMKRLTDITIHPYAIGDYAFANCSNLNRITLYGFSTITEDYNISDTAFEGVADKGVVVLYDDFFNNEEGETWVRDVFMAKLPSEWTFEIIKPK